MAIQNTPLGGGLNGAFTASVDYDDLGVPLVLGQLLPCTRLRFTNTTGRPFNVRLGNRDFNIGATEAGDRAIPNNALNLRVVGDPGDLSLAFDRQVSFGTT